MNKRPNPFMPNPYPQPPLPAGPPPPVPQQTPQYDYSAYWAAAAQAQQQQTNPAAAPQWAPPTVGAQPQQPPPRTSEQNALYANYGYGGAAGQQQAMMHAAQQQQQQRPAAPYWTPPAPGYPPVAPYPYPQPPVYQPQAPPPAMQYTPQAPQPHPQMPVYQPPPPQPQPPPQAQPPPRRFPPPQQQQQQQQQHHLPAPPAKRPRFDSGPPNPNGGGGFQPNPNWRGANNNNNNNGIPTGPAQHGNFPPQQPGFDRVRGRGGGGGGGGMMASSNRGRGFNRGGGGAGGGGGGFNRGNHGHNHPPRGPSGYRNPGPSGAPYGPRHGLPQNPTKREAKREREREGSYAESESATMSAGHGGKRTLTDFRIVGVECAEIGWQWGVIDRDEQSKKDQPKAEKGEKETGKTESGSTDGSVSPKVKQEPASPVKPPPPPAVSNPQSQPAPSRLRIYFHSASDPESEAVPRKRKKDADEEDEEGSVKKRVLQGVVEEREEEVKEKEKDKEDENKEDEVKEERTEENGLLGADQAKDGEPDGDANADVDANADEDADGDADADAEGEADDYSAQDQSFIHDLTAPNDPPTQPSTPTLLERSASSGAVSQRPPPTPTDLGATHEGDSLVVQPEDATTDENTEVLGLNTDSAGEIAKDVPNVVVERENPTDDARADEDGHSAAAVDDQLGSVDNDITGGKDEEQSTKTSPNDPPADGATSTNPEDDAPAEPEKAEDGAGADGSAADISISTMDESFSEPVQFPTLDPVTPNVNGQSTPLPLSHLNPNRESADRSANRISISYANSTRRLVIDADVVQKVRILRGKARVEITLNVGLAADEKEKQEEEKGTDEKEGDEKNAQTLVLGEHDRFRGVLVEAFDDSTQRYEFITPHAATSGTDQTIPDLAKVGHTPATVTITVHLDRDKPLTETKWVKTGDLDEWLSNEFGPLRPDPSGRANWSGKIEVVDPDPAPTITTLMDAWCGHTMVGQPKERRRFVRQHMSNIDHILEILLRLVRGERATATTSAGAAGQQTHVSLAVLAIFRVATDYGARAGVERKVVEERVSEIVRCLPTHLIYKSLDGMFREWAFVQKKEKGNSKS